MRTSTSIPRIYTDIHRLKHGELTEKLIGIFFNIYNELGHGFLESVYEQAFSIALTKNGIFISTTNLGSCLVSRSTDWRFPSRPSG